MTSSTFNLSTIRVLSQIQHGNEACRTELSTLADPTNIAVVAEKYARVYFKGDMEAAAQGFVEIVRAAALLCYAMERWGFNYDDIVQVGEHRIAAIVAEISSDVRLPEGPRIQYLCSQLGQARPIGQLVKLAQIVAVSSMILDEFTTDTLVKHGGVLRQVVDDNYQLLESLRHMKGNLRMGSAWTAAKNQMLAIIKRIDEARIACKSSHRFDPVEALAVAV